MLTNLLTWGSLAIETSVVFMMASARWRALGLGLGVALHGSIAVFATLTTDFSLAMLAPYASFLTGPDLDHARVAFKRPAPPRSNLKIEPRVHNRMSWRLQEDAHLQKALDCPSESRRRDRQIGGRARPPNPSRQH